MINIQQSLLIIYSVQDIFFNIHHHVTINVVTICCIYYFKPHNDQISKIIFGLSTSMSHQLSFKFFLWNIIILEVDVIRF